MRKLNIIILIVLLLIFNLSFVNSKFVCGIVNGSQDISSSWKEVIIYPEKNTSSLTKCQINPENKFCCDLDELPSVKLKVGEKIFAEVFDEEEGVVAGPVSLYLTAEGYDVFPPMVLEKVISISFPEEKIFINQSRVFISGELSQKYPNLKYSLNNSLGIIEEQICTNCLFFNFSIPLEKGLNELNLIAYGNREISEKMVFYNLDYLNFKLDVICDKCAVNKRFIYVPANTELVLSSFIESSHPISGDFEFYFPNEWNLINSTIQGDFSQTHKVITEEIINQRSYLVNYTLQSPNTFVKKVYSFSQKFESLELLSKTIVFKSKIIPFRNSKHFERDYFLYSLNQKGSHNNPIIINSEENSLNLVAIFPKGEILNSYSKINLYKEKNRRNSKEYSFILITNIPEKEIQNILLIFKIENGKNIEVSYLKKPLNLEIYKKEGNYTYYSGFVKEKGPFEAKIY